MRARGDELLVEGLLPEPQQLQLDRVRLAESVVRLQGRRKSRVSSVFVRVTEKKKRLVMLHAAELSHEWVYKDTHQQSLIEIANYDTW